MGHHNQWKRIAYMVLGLCFLVLAYFGILMPGFPAIPFILLAAFFFANSSDTLYQWMLRQKLLATLLAKARTKKGHTGFKLFVISQLWVSIIVALYLFVRDPYAIATILVAGTGCSIAMYTLMDR